MHDDTAKETSVKALPYTLRVTKGVIKHYVKEYLDKVYKDGYKFEINFRDLTSGEPIKLEEENSKNLCWQILEDDLDCELTINVDPLEIKDYSEVDHSDLLRRLGVIPLKGERDLQDEPLDFILSSHNLVDFTLKMGIRTARLMSAMEEMDDALSNKREYKGRILSQKIRNPHL